VASSCENGNEASGSVKHEEFFDCVTISFSRILLHGVNYILNLCFQRGDRKKKILN
jgi:hypothetical protein